MGTLSYLQALVAGLVPATAVVMGAESSKSECTGEAASTTKEDSSIALMIRGSSLRLASTSSTYANILAKAALVS